MTHGYTDIGDAIYDVMDGLDITDIYEDDWSERFNTPPKRYESYPSFVVAPDTDEQGTLDSRNDGDTFTFGVYLFDSFYESQTAEDRMRQLADLVRERFRAERDAKPPLGLSNVYDLQLSGAWGGNEDQQHRFYRLGLTIKVRQELD